VNSGLDNAIFQWEEGSRSLHAARNDPARQRQLTRAMSSIHAELRRRLGSSFSVAELADLYQAGTDWCLDIVLSMPYNSESPLDSATAIDAAFHLYMREASDFGGGRVLESGGTGEA